MAALSVMLVASAVAGNAPIHADAVAPWRPAIMLASRRFGVPSDWIERVMRAESGGQTMLDGRPIRSRAGAIGLMQLMPATWGAMRHALGLGADPDDHHDNILAGTAYLRILYDRFGYPGLFAAYNAGPARYADHLSTGRALPAETIAYLAKVGAAAMLPPSSMPAREMLFAIRYGSGGQLELYGGSQGLFQPAVEYAGASGGTSYFVSSSYQRDDLGVPSPDGSSVPRHDIGEQLEGLAFIDHVIDSASRVSLVAGVSDERSQIPEAPVPKQEAPSVADLAVNAVDGGELRTADRYGALSYQRSDGAAAFQIAAFGRSSSRRLQPGSSAGLDATGFGGSLHETSWTAGLQAEGSYSLGARQTVRAGGVFSYDHLEETLDLAIARPEAAPELASGASGVHRVLGSVFLQDEWKPLQHLTINLGGRLDRVGGLADATRVEPRVSFVWRSGTGTTVHAGYSRYLVAPRLYPEGQLALVTQPLSGVGGTSKDRLHAETDAYFDAGVDQTFADLTLRLDLFDRQAQDMLSRLDAGSPLVIKPFNFRHGVIRGFDASATYSEGPLSVWANFTYLHAAATGITSGGAYLPMAFLADADAHLIRPDGTPARAASGGASYKIENLRISGDASYSSGARGVTEDGDLSQARIPNNVQVNLAAILRLNGIGDCPLDARVDLVNAFDRRNRLADDSDLGIAQWGPGRSIFVGVEQSF